MPSPVTELDLVLATERWLRPVGRVHASLCNLRESRKERLSPVVVEESAGRIDVRREGLGGNVRDWTDWTASDEVQGMLS